MRYPQLLIVVAVMLASAGAAAKSVIVPPRMNPDAPVSQPRFPPEARELIPLGHTRTVVLLLWVNVHGEVLKARVSRSSGIPACDQSAVREARHWSMWPATVDGVPTFMKYRFAVTFVNGTGWPSAEAREPPPPIYYIPPEERMGSPDPYAPPPFRPPQIERLFVRDRSTELVPIIPITPKGPLGIVSPHSDPHHPITQPEFPPDALALIPLGHTRTVILLLTVDWNGRVTDAKIDTSSGLPSVDASALREALKWRLIPGTVDGVPMAMQYKLAITFKNDGPPTDDAAPLGRHSDRSSKSKP
jgi:TonB family protein